MKKLTAHSTHPTHLTFLTVLTGLTLAVSGCSLVSYTSPSGERFTRSSLGANTSISSLLVEKALPGIHAAVTGSRVRRLKALCKRFVIGPG